LPLAEGSAALEQGKLAFAEVSAPGAEFRVALSDLKLSFSEGVGLCALSLRNDEGGGQA
jgi:hypothetical protein